MTLVVDTSAVVAVLMDEPERDRFRDLLLRSSPVISAGSLVEAAADLGGRAGPRLRGMTFLELFSVQVVPVDEAQAGLAEEGNRRFGNGRSRPPAVLNFGDLFAYALARHLDAPLLFKGNDFSRTDLRQAL